MDIPNTQLLLKRPVTLKAIVTPRWKEEVQQQLQAQINQLDDQFQQLEMQGQRMVAEVQKQNLQTPWPSGDAADRKYSSSDQPEEKRTPRSEKPDFAKSATDSTPRNESRGVSRPDRGLFPH